MRLLYRLIQHLTLFVLCITLEQEGIKTVTQAKGYRKYYKYDSELNIFSLINYTLPHVNRVH